MGTWYSKDLGDGVQAYNPTRQIQDAFLAALTTARGPYEMALFGNRGTRGEKVIVYFSPRAEIVAKAFGAHPCEKPERREVALLVGDMRAWDLLFPGEADE